MEAIPLVAPCFLSKQESQDMKSINNKTKFLTHLQEEKYFVMSYFRFKLPLVKEKYLF